MGEGPLGAGSGLGAGMHTRRRVSAPESSPGVGGGRGGGGPEEVTPSPGHSVVMGQIKVLRGDRQKAPLSVKCAVTL